jgi:hypothetical protein
MLESRSSYLRGASAVVGGLLLLGLMMANLGLGTTGPTMEEGHQPRAAPNVRSEDAREEGSGPVFLRVIIPNGGCPIYVGHVEFTTNATIPTTTGPLSLEALPCLVYGYTFAGWSVGGSVALAEHVGLNATLDVGANGSIEPVWQGIAFSIRVNIQPATCGPVSIGLADHPSVDYSNGSEWNGTGGVATYYSVSAHDCPGHRLTGWVATRCLQFVPPLPWENPALEDQELSVTCNDTLSATYVVFEAPPRSGGVVTFVIPIGVGASVGLGMALWVWRRSDRDSDRW